MANSTTHPEEKKAPESKTSVGKVIEYFAAWIVFTLLLSGFPLLFRIIILTLFSQSVTMSEVITEIVFISVLLSADAIRVNRVSKKKSESINNIVLWLTIPTVLLSMGFYSILVFSIYANISLSTVVLTILLIIVVLSSLFVDFAVQIIYIKQGNLSVP